MKTRITILTAASMVLLTLIAAHVQAQNALWGITLGGQLIDINTTTGVGTLIANTGLNSAQGLELDNNGDLLAIAAAPGGSVTNTLWKIDLANPASPAVVGLLGPAALISQAMTFDATGTTLFASGGTDNALPAPENLVTVSTIDGSATVVGPFGPDPNDPRVVDVDSMAMASNGPFAGRMFGFDSDGLFRSQNSNSFLFVEIDPVTGSAITVQPYAGKPTNGVLVELEFSDDGNTLFGATVPTVNGGAGRLATVDPLTGNITHIGPIGFSNVFGMAFVPIPEPSTFTLAALGLMGIGYRSSHRVSPIGEALCT